MKFFFFSNLTAKIANHERNNDMLTIDNFFKFLIQEKPFFFFLYCNHELHFKAWLNFYIKHDSRDKNKKK